MNKPKPHLIPSVVSEIIGLPVETAPGGLIERLRGTDLDDPKDVLRTLWVVLGDLNRFVSAADDSLPGKLLPGLGRHPRYEDGSGVEA